MVILGSNFMEYCFEMERGLIIGTILRMHRLSLVKEKGDRRVNGHIVKRHF